MQSFICACIVHEAPSGANEKRNHHLLTSSLWAWNQAWIGLHLFQPENACSKLILPYSVCVCVLNRKIYGQSA